MSHAVLFANKEDKMPEFENEEYTFPDEQEKKVAPESEIEFEIEDDTPEEDRNREPMPKAIVDELEQDDLSKYDEATKQKLKQMRKVWHDERRAKESAYREQQEAVELARRVLEENKRIKSMLATGEKEYVNSIQSTANLELEMAKRAYKDAYDNGDSDRLVEAQQAMQEASIKIAQAKSFKLPPLQDDNNNVQSNQEQYQQPAAPAPDARAQAWRDRNDWFGADEEMTATALGLHEKLKRNGVVVGSDDYYSTLDKTMRKRFSEYFEDSEPENSRGKNESAPTKLSTVVAPATRSTSSNKIKLSVRQVALAKKLGLTNEQYALAMKKLEV
jgi:hypothetical protein